MDRLKAYELGLLTGLEKSGNYGAFFHTAMKMDKLVKVAKQLKDKGKPVPQLEKLAAWYNHILPGLMGGITTGMMGAATPLGPWGALAAIPGAAYGIYQSMSGQPEQPKELTQLPSEARSLMNQSGMDPRLIEPIQRPSWLTPEVEQYMQMYGVDPMALLFRQRLMDRNKREQSKRELTQKTEEQDAAKPISFAEYAKTHPMPQMPAQASWRNMPIAGMPYAPPAFNIPRQRAPMGSPNEESYWRKWTGKTPAMIKADFAPLAVLNARRVQGQDFEDYARRAFGNG